MPFLSSRRHLVPLSSAFCVLRYRTDWDSIFDKA
jgi:hypothetical protein